MKLLLALVALWWLADASDCSGPREAVIARSIVATTCGKHGPALKSEILLFYYRDEYKGDLGNHVGGLFESQPPHSGALTTCGDGALVVIVPSEK
jgi:hypothetical protein